jgi:Flp pilus assembly protein protease CpaA
MWLVGSGGGGDAKYMGALGAMFGPRYILYVFLFGAVVTVIASVCVLVYEAMRLGFGRARARYATAVVVKNRGSAEQIEKARQDARTRRRIMTWALPAGIASWLVLAHMLFLTKQ